MSGGEGGSFYGAVLRKRKKKVGGGRVRGLLGNLSFREKAPWTPEENALSKVNCKTKEIEESLPDSDSFEVPPENNKGAAQKRGGLGGKDDSKKFFKFWKGKAKGGGGVFDRAPSRLGGPGAALVGDGQNRVPKAFGKNPKKGGKNK